MTLTVFSVLVITLAPTSTVFAESTVLAGSGWLAGVGVDVMSDGNDSKMCVAVANAPATVHCPAGTVWSGHKWQCVELVNRLFLTKGWTTTTWMGNGNTIGDSVPAGLVKQTNGQISYINPGDAVSMDDGGDYGHANIIDNMSGTTINLINQNAQLNSSAYIFSGSLATNNAFFKPNNWAGYSILSVIHRPTDSGTGSGSSSSNVIQVKRTNQGSTQQAYVATTSHIYERYWNAPGSGQGTIINIAQNNIVGMDKIVQPDGTQTVYTAVPDGVWETYWNASSNGPQSSKIISGLSGVKKVIATSQTDANGYTHLLYVLAADGPYEYWWRDGGDGIHSSRLSNINNGFDMVKNTVGGVHLLFTATAGAVWQTAWGPGVSLGTGPIISIAQNNIVAIDEVTSPGGAQQLYTAVPGGVWESKWGGDVGSMVHSYIVNNLSNVVDVQKGFDAAGTNQLYVATNGHVQQYWWHATASGGGTLINHTNIATIDQVSGSNQLYTGAGVKVWETWWDGSGIHTGDPALVQL